MTLSSDIAYTNPVTGCWEWLGPRTDDTGYGRFGSTMAHRAVYILLKGPIPDGLALDHLCRFKPCVNPDHLELVTAAENTARIPARDHDAGSMTPGAPVEVMMPSEAADLFRVDPRTLVRWANDGKLATTRTPGGHRRYLVPSELVAEYRHR